MRAYLTGVFVAILAAFALPPSRLETAAQKKTIELLLRQSACENGHKVKGKCFPNPK